MKQNELPTDKYGRLMQVTPKGTALATFVNNSLSVSVEVNLETDTTFLRVYAIDQDIYLRWGKENANASIFDEIIPASQIVDLAVPNKVNGSKHTAFNIVERVAGATAIIIQK